MSLGKKKGTIFDKEKWTKKLRRNFNEAWELISPWIFHVDFSPKKNLNFFWSLWSKLWVWLSAPRTIALKLFFSNWIWPQSLVPTLPLLCCLQKRVLIWWHCLKLHWIGHYYIKVSSKFLELRSGLLSFYVKVSILIKF